MRTTSRCAEDALSRPPGVQPVAAGSQAAGSAARRPGGSRQAPSAPFTGKEQSQGLRRAARSIVVSL